MVLVGTSAYTAPTFTMAEGTMTAVADRWFPRPNVTWMDHDQKVLQATTSMTENSAGIFRLVSRLPQVNTSETYTVHIHNQLVQSVSRARIAGTLGGTGDGGAVAEQGEAEMVMVSTLLFQDPTFPCLRILFSAERRTR